jgi:hypothetical protein
MMKKEKLKIFQGFLDLFEVSIKIKLLQITIF